MAISDCEYWGFIYYAFAFCEMAQRPCINSLNKIEPLCDQYLPQSEKTWKKSGNSKKEFAWWETIPFDLGIFKRPIKPPTFGIFG